MDTKEWTIETVVNPNQFLPQIIIGPYQGWSLFFKNNLQASFAEALEIPEFFNWCGTHNRIVPLSQNFPDNSTIILFQKPDSTYIHIEGGHRICAVAYSKKINQPVDFRNKIVKAVIASITEEEVVSLQKFLHEGTHKK